MVASEKIGRDTVQYVSDIHKYYPAYQMIEEQRAEREKAKESVKQEMPTAARRKRKHLKPEGFCV